MKDGTIQYMQRLKEMANETTSKEYRHKWLNWKDWIVYEAYRNEILTLKRDSSDALGDDSEHRLSAAERTRIHFEVFSFMEFIYRTWTDKCADEWAAGGTWHRATEAFFARLLYEGHKKGATKVRLRAKPPGFEDNVKKFCEVFGIAL